MASTLRAPPAPHALLQLLKDRLASGCPLRLAALGGSSTAGHSLPRSSSALYHARLTACLCQGYHAKRPAVRMEVQHPRSIFVTPAHWTFHALRTIIMHNSSRLSRRPILAVGASDRWVSERHHFGYNDSWS